MDNSIAPDEAERLAALRRYDILDSPSEAEFDDITRLAARLCDVPVAQITLVDADRQWYKSNFGVDVPQVPRAIGFCAHTILRTTLLEIPDLLDDVRFRDNPFVAGPPDIRFYAGSPLVSPDGFNIGALCVLDTTPRSLSDEQRESLAALSRQVMRLITARLAVRQQHVLNAELRESEALNRELNANLERLVVARAAALAESEERFRQFAEQSTEAFWFVALNPLCLLHVSEAMAVISGRPCEWFARDPLAWIDIIHVEDRREVESVWADALRGQSPRFEVECRVVRAAGDIRWVVFSGIPIRSTAGEVIRLGGMMRDITEARDLRVQLLQSQRVESVGRLAAGVAHDFNNLLTIINGAAEMAATALGPDNPARADLEEITNAGNRAAILTRQLLSFSRKQVLRPSTLSMNAVVNELLSMLRRLIGANMELVFHPASELAMIRADGGQAEQIVVNLVINARDAMPDGGTITIVAANDTGPAGLTMPGGRVMLQVTDTGTGMDDATQARIFEPFFTTKREGSGTGLGLSTVQTIVNQSGGTIEVESTPGRGTTFRVFLPAIAEDAREPTIAAASAMPLRGSETVLVVDDDEAVRNLSSRILQAAGYNVIVAKNGDHAIEMLISPPRVVDLVVTDMIMPGLSGLQLVKRISEVSPGTRLLFVSGYPGDILALEESAPFVAKPFSSSQLRAKVREVLDTGR